MPNICFSVKKHIFYRFYGNFYIQNAEIDRNTAKCLKTLRNTERLYQRFSGPNRFYKSVPKIVTRIAVFCQLRMLECTVPQSSPLSVYFCATLPRSTSDNVHYVYFLLEFRTLMYTPHAPDCTIAYGASGPLSDKFCHPLCPFNAPYAPQLAWLLQLQFSCHSPAYAAPYA